ncbi:hypothetical protein [Xanthomonas oryzae]|uniref:hypothetical protein n=1 Tax=Xanthomonas oryzae TaxID=347 RepID=UPI001A93DFD2|nr:hypothetical protein [Xanthomonas oryzae]
MLRQELADERADELTLALHTSGDVLSETLGELTTEKLGLIAGHLAQGNDEGALRSCAPQSPTTVAADNRPHG